MKVCTAVIYDAFGIGSPDLLVASSSEALTSKVRDYFKRFYPQHGLTHSEIDMQSIDDIQKRFEERHEEELIDAEIHIEVEEHDL